MNDRTSRYRRAALFLDNGLLRPGRKTIFHGAYPRLRFQERRDNLRFRVRRGDTLDHLATVFYQDPRLWWIIADYQPEDSDPILAPLEPMQEGRTIIVPSVSIVRTFFSLE
jgi:hypothetical protein